MNISYVAYRSKNKEEIIDASTIQYILNDDKDLIEFDIRLKKLISQHLLSIPIIIKNGSAYIGKVEIIRLEITDEDYLGYIDENQFKEFMLTLPDELCNIPIKWSRTKDVKK